MAYEKGGKVLEWKGGATSGVDVDALANCSSLWLKTVPYRPRPDARATTLRPRAFDHDARTVSDPTH